jgi:hypothetical protein
MSPAERTVPRGGARLATSVAPAVFAAIVTVSIGLFLVPSPVGAVPSPTAGGGDPTTTTLPTTTTTTAPTTTTTTTTAPTTTTTRVPTTTTTTHPTHPTTTTSSSTTTTTIAHPTTHKTSSSTPWGLIVLIVVLVVAILVVLWLLLARRRKMAEARWRRLVAPAMSDAQLARESLLSDNAMSEDPELRGAVGEQSERAATALERAASSAPDDDAKALTNSAATSLRGLAFAVEADRLLRQGARAPTGAQLAEADAAKRSRTSELNAALQRLSRRIGSETAQAEHGLT